MNHISHVCSKVSRSLAVVKKLYHFVPFGVLHKLFYALIYPYLTYGIEVWGEGSKTQLKRLNSLVGRCVHLVVHGGNRENVSNLNSLLTIDDIHKYYVLIKMFKYNRIYLSNHFSFQYNLASVSHNINTRFSLNENLNLPDINTSSFQRSFIVRSIKFWNEIPVQIKKIQNLKKFKAELLKYMTR